MSRKTVLHAVDPERRSVIAPALRAQGFEVVEIDEAADMELAAAEAGADLIVGPVDAVAHGGRHGPLEEVAGSSAAAGALRRSITRAGLTHTGVLITGSRGAAFERIAWAIHARSPRRNAPFIALACATLPAELAATELLGRPGVVGRLRQASSGTLFLEEIGALSHDAQEGLHASLHDDVRVIASTTRDLETDVRGARFSAALLGRLTDRVVIPPLHERIEDLPALVERYLASHRRALGGVTPTISAAALERLATHAWPGDVGELGTVLDHALAVGHRERIDVTDLQLADKPLDETDLPAERSYFKTSVAALECDLITTALRDAGGNRSRAAEVLGIYRRLLYAKIREYGLEGFPKKTGRG